MHYARALAKKRSCCRRLDHEEPESPTGAKGAAVHAPRSNKLRWRGRLAMLLEEPEEATMFKHILIPTDASELSRCAVEGGIPLARTLGACVTAFHVIARFNASDVIMGLLAESRGDHEKATREFAETQLDFVTSAAQAAGVACDTVHATGDEVVCEIVGAASRIGCDLIRMALHGRRGIDGVLLGSETHKMLTHSQLPVLVYR